MAKKNDWQVPVMIGAGVLVALGALWLMSRKNNTSQGYHSIGAYKGNLPSMSRRQPSRSYSDCGCGI